MVDGLYMLVVDILFCVRYSANALFSIATPNSGNGTRGQPLFIYSLIGKSIKLTDL